MKFVILVCIEYNRDEPTHTYVGRTKAEVMQQFRRDFAEFIDDWKHFDDDELVQRCTYNGVGMFFDEHELSSTNDPDADLRELVEKATNVAAHFKGASICYRDDSGEALVVSVPGGGTTTVVSVLAGDDPPNVAAIPSGDWARWSGVGACNATVERHGRTFYCTADAGHHNDHVAHAVGGGVLLRWRMDVLIDGCPVYGAFSALDGDPGEGLIGRTVTMLLKNGTIITGVKLLPWDVYAGERRFTYRLPYMSMASVVSPASVAALYVHRPPRPLPGKPMPVALYVGDTPPRKHTKRHADRGFM